MCRLDMAHEFRGARLSTIRKHLDVLQKQFDQGYEELYLYDFSRRTISVNSFKDAQFIYNTLCKQDEFRIRVTYKELGIYSLEKDWLKDIADNVSIPIEWWEPESELEPIEPGVVYLKNDNGFEYRVTVKGHLNQESAEWLLNNQDKVKLGPTFIQNLQMGMYYLDNMYLYVRNERCMSLVTLIMGSNIRRSDKVVAMNKNA